MLPLITHAVWWNPKTWIEPQIKYVEKTVEVPANRIVEVEKPIEKVVTKTVDNPLLLARIKELENEVKNLKVQLAAAQSKTLGNDSVQQISVISNDDARKIKVKLAELDQMDWEIDNVTSGNLLKKANALLTLEGKRLFNANEDINLRSVNTGAYGIMISLPDLSTLHFIVNNYRNTLKIRLAELE